MITSPIIGELISSLSSVASWPNSLHSCYTQSLTHTNWVILGLYNYYLGLSWNCVWYKGEVDIVIFST